MTRTKDATPDWQFLPGLFGGGNSTLKGEDFYISFNGNPGEGLPLLGGDTDEGETALCYGGKYFILNGDFRKDYEQLLAKGFDECFKFYEKNKVTAQSSWASDSKTA